MLIYKGHGAIILGAGRRTRERHAVELLGHEDGPDGRLGTGHYGGVPGIVHFGQFNFLVTHIRHNEGIRDITITRTNRDGHDIAGLGVVRVNSHAAAGSGSYRYTGAAGGALSVTSAPVTVTVVTTAAADIGKGNSDSNGTIVGNKLTNDFLLSGIATKALNGKLNCVITSGIGTAADFIVQLGSSRYGHRITDGDYIASYIINIVTDLIG